MLSGGALGLLLLSPLFLFILYWYFCHRKDTEDESEIEWEGKDFGGFKNGGGRGKGKNRKKWKNPRKKRVKGVGIRSLINGGGIGKTSPKTMAKTRSSKVSARRTPFTAKFSGLSRATCKIISHTTSDSERLARERKLKKSMQLKATSTNVKSNGVQGQKGQIGKSPATSSLPTSSSSSSTINQPSVARSSSNSKIQPSIELRESKGGETRLVVSNAGQTRRSAIAGNGGKSGVHQQAKRNTKAKSKVSSSVLPSTKPPPLSAQKQKQQKTPFKKKAGSPASTTVAKVRKSAGTLRSTTAVSAKKSSKK